MQSARKNELPIKSIKQLIRIFNIKVLKTKNYSCMIRLHHKMRFFRKILCE